MVVVVIIFNLSSKIISSVSNLNLILPVPPPNGVLDSNFSEDPSTYSHRANQIVEWDRQWTLEPGCLGHIIPNPPATSRLRTASFPSRGYGVFLACSKHSTSASCHHHYYHCHHFNYYHPCPTTWKQCSEVSVDLFWNRLPISWLSVTKPLSLSAEMHMNISQGGQYTEINTQSDASRGGWGGEYSTPMGPVSFSLTPSHPVLHKSCLVYLPNKCQLHPLLSSSTTAPSSQSHPHQASLAAQW